MNLELHISGKSYPQTGQVLAPMELSVPTGQFLCILGPSGCGKTTLLHIIASLTKPDQPVRHHDATDHSIGYVFQEPRLMPWLTVLDNVLLIANNHDKDHHSRARSILKQVGLDDKENAYPRHLSGGQKRRVALARAFFKKPSLLLMDEPFASLDTPRAQQLQELTLALWKKNNTTIVFVTHNLEESLLLGERIILLGGTPTTILYDNSTTHPTDIRNHYEQFYHHKKS